MGAPLDNAAGLQHEDLIAGRHALQSMGYKHNRAPAFEGAQCVQQKLLVVRIKRACGFIQDQKRRSAQQSPCYGNPLALTTREVLPTFSQKGVIPVWQVSDEGICPGQFSRPLDLTPTRAGSPVSNVGGDAGRKHEAVLSHKRHMGPGIRQSSGTEVDAVQAQSPRGRIVEAQHQRQKCALA